MGRIIFGALFCLLSWAGQGLTEENEREEKESSGSSSFGGTIGPIVKVSQLGDGVLTTVGGRLNGTLFSMFILGIEGQAAVKNSDLKIGGIAENNVSYYYGGLGLGVRLFPGSFIHLTNYNSFGLGKMNLKGRGASGLVYSIEPELNAEIDLFSLMRIGAGLSYRFLFGNSLSLPKKSDLFGFGGQVYLEFGWL